MIVFFKKLIINGIMPNQILIKVNMRKINRYFLPVNRQMLIRMRWVEMNIRSVTWIEKRIGQAVIIRICCTTKFNF